MKSLFSRRFSHKSPARRITRSFRPSLESMEERAVLSCTVSLANAGHTLVITGDGGTNNVSIVQDDVNNKLIVTCDSVTQTFQSGQITKLSVDLMGGADNFSWKLANGSGYQLSKTADIHLGEGKDTADFEIGVGPDQGHWVQGSLHITVDGGAGEDSINANFGHKHGGVLNFTAKGGNDNDEIYARLWGDVSGGANVTFNLFGQKGDDTIGVWNTFDQDAYSYASIDITHDSSVTLNVGGGEGKDTIDVLHAGDVEGKLTMNAHGDKCNDTVKALVHLTAGSDGTVDLAVNGNDGDDNLAFLLTKDAGATPNVVKAVLDGGAGHDVFHWLETGGVTKKNVEGAIP